MFSVHPNAPVQVPLLNFVVGPSVDVQNTVLSMGISATSK